MLIADLFSWWYSTGWLRILQRMKSIIAGIFEAFSVLLLLQTLFSPFRQISASPIKGGLDVELRAWLDLQLSRFIGALVRLCVIVAGLAVAASVFIFMLVSFIIWPLVPVIPIITIVVTIGLIR